MSDEPSSAGAVYRRSDRDLSWLGGPSLALPVYPECTVWRVEKDTRWADSRIRDVPHGLGLRFVVGGAGRGDALMHITPRGAW